MTMPHEFEPDELVAYEAQQEEPATPAPMAPVPVYVDEPVVTVPTVPQHLTTRTVVLNDANPVQVLGLDPLRVRAQFIVKGANDVVLCHSVAQAQDPVNADTTLARPNGTIIPAALTAPVDVTTTGPAWLVGNTFPTRVGVIIERRGA